LSPASLYGGSSIFESRQPLHPGREEAKLCLFFFIIGSF
jgi:hypothetical protein